MTGHDPDAWRRFLEFKGALVQAWKLRDSANAALDSDPRVATALPSLFRSEWNLAGAKGGPHRRALANRYGLELNTFYRAPPAPWKEYKITSVRDSRRGSAYHARERSGLESSRSDSDSVDGR